MLLLLAATFFYTKNKRSLLLFAATSAFVFGWTFLALKTTVDARIPLGETTSNIIIFYLKDPLQFFSVIWQTLSNDRIREDYYRSFFGVLGSLDAPFRTEFYKKFLVITSVVALLTLSLRGVRDNWHQRLLLFFVSIISILFIFFALLVTWTHHPAETISGVQGRYFLIPMIVLAYGIAGDLGLFDDLRRRIATALVFCLLLFSLAASVDLLIGRYYLIPFHTELENIVHRFNKKDDQLKMIASVQLSKEVAIPLAIPLLDEDDFGKFTSIGILFGTYMRDNPGEAELLLNARDGSIYRQKFNLLDLIDGNYKNFKILANSYISGEIRFLSGGGVSVWEVHSDSGQVLACLNIISNRNKNLSIQGCP